MNAKQRRAWRRTQCNTVYTVTIKSLKIQKQKLNFQCELLQLQDTLHTSISSSRTLDEYSSLRNISISFALPLAMKVKDLLKLWRKLSVSFSSRLCACKIHEWFSSLIPQLLPKVIDSFDVS